MVIDFDLASLVIDRLEVDLTLKSIAIARFAPIMPSISEFAAQGGFVYGICNGFQILCESHLLPGVLLPNTSQKYRCMNVHLRTETTNSMLTSAMEKGQVVKIPIAHADGRYYADPATLQSLKENDQIIFKYSDASGNTDEQANPNGAIDNIAGICNTGRNVYGMMPHPERASESIHGNTDGMFIFRSILQSLVAMRAETSVPA